MEFRQKRGIFASTQPNVNHLKHVCSEKDGDKHDKAAEFILCYVKSVIHFLSNPAVTCAAHAHQQSKSTEADHSRQSLFHILQFVSVAFKWASARSWRVSDEIKYQ
jgi:hypothetical protein